MAFNWPAGGEQRSQIMGILNVTPDSFSDGGDHADPGAAIAAGLAMAADGADIIDVGGESTRPGAAFVPASVEQVRVIPVIRALAAQGLRVSVDTRNADTMVAALDAGAVIVNDVSALSHDPRALGLVAERGCAVVLMHMRGTPETMQAHAHYDDVVRAVRDELAARIDAAIAAGIDSDRIAIDPGIGFAKTAEQSMALLRGLRTLGSLGRPILVGISRKSFIGRLTDETVAKNRLGGSLAAGLFAVSQGAAILRVHDVQQTVQALRIWHGLAQ